MIPVRAHPHSTLDELRRYWRGDGALWKLFWVYGVLASSAGSVLLTTAVLKRILAPPALVPLLALALLYTGFILVAIWRNASNIASDPLGIDRDAWGWIARILTFGWAINASGGCLMLLQVALGY